MSNAINTTRVWIKQVNQWTRMLNNLKEKSAFILWRSSTSADITTQENLVEMQTRKLDSLSLAMVPPVLVDAGIITKGFGTTQIIITKGYGV